MSRQRAIDVGLALLALAATLALISRGGEAGDRDVDALGVALAALASLPLVAWRRSPLGVFVLVTAASAALSAIGYSDGPPFGPTIALFLLVSSRPPTRTTVAVVAVMFAAHVLATGLDEGEVPVVPLLFGTTLWLGVWFAADFVRRRRERVAELEERALRAEREAEQERRVAVAEERTRIARDLHDSAGHAINVILVQAGAARLLQDRDPEGARRALGTIEEVARETLGEIDRLVGALREDGAGGRVEPPLGLAALEALVERQRSAGLAVELRAEGARRPLPPAADQAAYRIAQEALTNAARHGDGGAAVSLAYGTDALELVVTNPAAPGPPPREGHGIVGMRERAALAGGALETGVTGATFTVRARLPYGGKP